MQQIAVTQHVVYDHFNETQIALQGAVILDILKVVGLFRLDGVRVQMEPNFVIGEVFY